MGAPNVPEPPADVATAVRELAPGVLGAMMRRYGEIDSCEDAVQEALIAAAREWPRDGSPDNPFGWLLSVASHRWIDQIRTDASRRARERSHATGPVAALANGSAADARAVDHDDTLRLLLLCCHPSLSPSSQIALTLRAVGGLTTSQIASAFFCPESTMAQRISRAKKTIRDAGAEFNDINASDRGPRIDAMLHVLYLIFTEGHLASGGSELMDLSLSTEAIRIARLAVRALPEDGEATGLLALMLLTEARSPTRVDADGELVPLAEQDRTRWRRDLIDEGVALVTAALSSSTPGPYQLQAAIAAVHDEAPTTDRTDWPEILGLYDLLERVAPGPMVSLNRAVAVAEVYGPERGIRALEDHSGDPRLAHHHRFLATRAHLREQLGDRSGAAADYRSAAQRATNEMEKRYLAGRSGSLDE